MNALLQEMGWKRSKKNFPITAPKKAIFALLCYAMLCFAMLCCLEYSKPKKKKIGPSRANTVLGFQIISLSGILVCAVHNRLLAMKKKELFNKVRSRGLIFTAQKPAKKKDLPFP